MSNLFRYLKPYRREAVLAPLFKMLEASFELFVPLVVAGMIDQGIRAHESSAITRGAFLLVGLALIGLACSVTAQYFSAKAAVSFTSDIRRDLFAHLLDLSYTEIDHLGTSAMITHMTSDMNQIQTGLNLTLRLLLRSPFVVFGATIMAFYVNARAAWIFAVLVPVLCVVVFTIMLLNIPLYRKVQERLDKVVRIGRENLSGARVIRAFDLQEKEIDTFRSESGLLYKVQIRAGALSALMNPVTYVIVNLALVILIRSGAVRVNAGGLTQGELTALVNYMSQILVELIKMANLIISITRAMACAKRVQSVFDIQPSLSYGKLTRAEAADASEKDGAILEIRNAGLVYHEGSDAAIEDVNLKIRRGQTVGVIGGTGSGKTSLVHLIAGNYPASDGEVLLYGRDIYEYTRDDLHHIVSVVSQDNLLFRGTIEDNLRWGNETANEKQIRRALEISQSAEFVDARPGGLGSMVEQGGRNLSGGQRQRLCIARTLLRDPDILILDDSSSALDYATDAKLRLAISGMEQRPAVIIVSQRASSIMGSDLILVLDDGRIIARGTHDELMKSCPEYVAMYRSQVQEGGERA